MTLEEFLDRIDKIMCGTSNAERACLEDLYNEVVAPHWISVEDELPPRWETNPNVSVPAITFGTFSESGIPFVELQRYHFGDGRWLYGKPTHWMPFQFPKKGGEE